MRADMWDDIEAALGSAASANLSSGSAGNDLYECYVWALVLEAARREGATIRLLNRTGAPSTSFWFRTSPSAIFSTAHDYCHAQIDFPSCPSLEAHIGIYVRANRRSIMSAASRLSTRTRPTPVALRVYIHDRARSYSQLSANTI